MGCSRVVYQVTPPSYGDGRIFRGRLSLPDDHGGSTSVLFQHLHSPMGTGRCTFVFAFRKTCSRNLFYLLEKIPETFTKVNLTDLPWFLFHVERSVSLLKNLFSVGQLRI